MTTTPSTASRSGSFRVTDSDRRQETKDPLAKGLGWFSLGLGVPQFLAPGRFARTIGVRPNGRRRVAILAVGAREIVGGIGILTSRRPTGWLWARVAGDVEDLTLLARALRTPDAKKGRVATAMASVAGAMVLDMIESLRLSRSDGSDDRPVRQAVTVRRPREQVYAFWRDFQNLPSFMIHLESVQDLGNGRSHWKAKAPLGMTAEWDAELVEEEPGKRISWRSLENASVKHAGTVLFTDAPGDRGTEVHVELRYAAPGGALGATVAKLLGEEPEAQTYDDLRRFKQVMETGEVVRSEGSPLGTSLLQQLRQRAAQAAGREHGTV